MPSDKRASQAGELIPFSTPQSLDDILKSYDAKLQKSDQLLKDACAKEMKELERAQSNFQKALQRAMDSEEMAELEDSIDREQARLDKTMRGMQRELHRMEDKIDTDVTLDDAERRRRHDALHRAASDELRRVSSKYPAVMRAQMLSQVRLIR